MNLGDRAPYDYRNCQSLFGYASAAHARSGGICILCGFGGREIDFDAWRQLTVEHLIGDSQGGYKPAILAALTDKWPMRDADELRELVTRLDALNTVTACSFCNSTTSRTQAPMGLREVIASAPEDIEGLVRAVEEAVGAALARKREDVAWKIASVRRAFDSQVAPLLQQARARRSG
jgi:hypothetical protein